MSIVLKGAPDTCDIFVVSKRRVKTKLASSLISSSKFRKTVLIFSHICFLFVFLVYNFVILFAVFLQWFFRQKIRHLGYNPTVNFL